MLIDDRTRRRGGARSVGALRPKFIHEKKSMHHERCLKWTHGPALEPGGARFRLWAPAQDRVSVIIENGERDIPISRGGDGFFEAFVEGVGAGQALRVRAFPTGAAFPTRIPFSA